MSSFIAPLLGGVSGLLGGLFPPKVKTDQTTTQSSQANQSANGQTSGSVTPDLSPFQQQLAALFTKGAGDLYGQSTNLTPYTTGGLQQIQQQGSANNQTIANIMAARGLSSSPAAGTALTQNTLNSGNQASTFLQSIPLLQRQLQTQGLQGLISAFGALPTAVNSTGQSSQTGESSSSGTSHLVGTNVQSGNPAAGAVSGFGAGLLAPSGAGNGTTDNALTGIINMFKPKPGGGINT